MSSSARAVVFLACGVAVGGGIFTRIDLDGHRVADPDGRVPTADLSR